jgi:hypothetical protein
MPYQRRDQDWGPAPAAARADRLVVRATNVAAAVVDARRARVSCAPRLVVTSDGPLDLRIACTPPAGCPATLRIALPRLRGRRIVAATVFRGRRALLRARGHDLGSVSLARPSRGAFTLRVVLRAAGTPARTVTLLRRYRAC